MAKKGSLEDRILSEQTCFMGLTNDMMVCRNCTFRYRDKKVYEFIKKMAEQCEVYPNGKPNSIKFDGGSCEYYIVE